MRKSRPFVKPFLQVLKDLHSLFQKIKSSLLLIGGLAVSLTAKPRATRDIDAIAPLNDDQLVKLFEQCPQFHFEPRISNALQFARNRHVLLLRHKRTGITIDVSLALLPFQREMIERSREVRLGTVKIRIPTPEDIIITKAVAHRPKDLIDITSILEAHPRVDKKRIRHWVKEFAAVLEMPEIVEDWERLLRKKRS